MKSKDKASDLAEIEKIRAELAELKRRKEILDATPSRTRSPAKASTKAGKGGGKKSDGAKASTVAGDSSEDAVQGEPSASTTSAVLKKSKPKRSSSSKSTSKGTKGSDVADAAKPAESKDSGTAPDGTATDPASDPKKTPKKAAAKGSKKTASKPVKNSTKKTPSARTKKTTTTAAAAKGISKKPAPKGGSSKAKPSSKKGSDSAPAVPDGSTASTAKPKKAKKISPAKPAAKNDGAKPKKGTAKAAKDDPGDEKKPDVPELTLEEKLESELTEEEIERFQIEKVNMEQLIRKICDILAEHESTGMLQNDLWKKLKLSDMIGSRLALKLERMGTITREKLLENSRWTYRLILKKTPISTVSIEDAPCLVCPVEQKCTIDGEISPRTCQYIEDWVVLAMKKSRSK